MTKKEMTNLRLENELNLYKKKLDREVQTAEKKHADEIKKLTEQLEQSRNAKPVNFLKSSAKKGDYTLRIIVGDQHGVKMNVPAVQAFFGDLRKIKFPAGSEIIDLGDLIDVGGALDESHTLGYVAELSESSYEDDIYHANQYLNEVQGITKGLPHFILEGNHEHRIEKWCVKQSGGNKKDAIGFLNRNGPEAVLKMKERNITYCRSTETNGTNIKGVLKRGKCLFTHGMSYALNASKTHYDKLGMSVCHGHTHRFDSYYANSASGTYGAWSFGCLCEPQPCWSMPRQGITNHVNGYGIQIVEKNGNFVTIPIPIINGQSLLGHLI